MAKVVLVFVVLVVSTGAITAIGASLTPSYGAMTPWRTLGVDDLRTTPTPTGWTTDLAREILPGVPKRCVGFTSSSVSGESVVLTGHAPSLGSSTGCTASTVARVTSTVALLDTATGRVRWSRNLVRAVPGGTGSADVTSTMVAPEASRAVVNFTLDGRDRLAAIDLSTGRVTGSLDLASASEGVSTTGVRGTLALFGASTSREGATAWTLVDVRHLSKPIWSAVIQDQNTPIVTSKAAFAIVKGRSVRIDGTTGGVTTLGGGRVPIDNATSSSDGQSFYTTDFVDGSPIVTAWTDDGRLLWSKSGVGGVSGVSRDCLLVSLPGTTKMTCVDRSTGRSRWTAEVGPAASGSDLLGQTNDDVYVVHSQGERSEVAVLDGRTGRQRFTLELPVLSTTALAARTAGYAVSFTTTGSTTGVRAFDMSTGRTLWERLSSRDGDTELWGGHLVTVSDDGLARELTNRHGMVLGG